MELKTTDFEFIRALSHRHAGLVIEPDKQYLVRLRLDPLAVEFHCKSLEEFIAQLRNQKLPDGAYDKVVHALTTNETYFFRDEHPFECLRDSILPQIIERRRSQRSLRIWSSACATGQEPYSIAMLIHESFPELLNWNISLIASDLNREVLNRAQAGQYNRVEINRGLSDERRLRFFNPEGALWTVKPEIAQMVNFQQVNLIGPWSIQPTFDVILLRNVMIYFDVPTKKRILEKMRGLLDQEGFLMLGGAETTVNLDPHYTPIYERKSVYFKSVLE